jgi:hypothetical protein
MLHVWWFTFLHSWIFHSCRNKTRIKFCERFFACNLRCFLSTWAAWHQDDHSVESVLLTRMLMMSCARCSSNKMHTLHCEQGGQQASWKSSCNQHIDPLAASLLEDGVQSDETIMHLVDHHVENEFYDEWRKRWLLCKIDVKCQTKYGLVVKWIC